MKLLMFYANQWWYRPASKSLPDAPEAEKFLAITSHTGFPVRFDRVVPTRLRGNDEVW